MELPFQLPIPADPDVSARVDRLELPFSEHGIDPYGAHKGDLSRAFTLLKYIYRYYFNVQVYGIENVPARGGTMLVGNHSGGVAVDGMIVLASTFFEMEPPRLAQGMADKFLTKLPFSGQLLSRTGQFTGLPEHAARLLRDDRMLTVFPEGARGTAKLFPERDSLVRFGTGFMRLALETGKPIVPFAFVGGGEAVPTVTNLYALGKLMGVPYIPLTPWLLPLPKPCEFQLLFSEPMVFEGTGNEDDERIQTYVEQVKARIAKLIKQGRDLREGRISESELELK
ncbi:MAG: lysophospholipid acyltransferase family protein [Myxococcota bacterium]